MTDFNKTNWAKQEFTRGYRDNADIFIVERRRMLSILQSFYVHFVRNGAPKALLDLGCGDGIVTAAIADADDSIAATLVDGSEEMLRTARERLKGLRNPRFIRSSFQEMIREDTVRGEFDFIASSLAIHHLTMSDKKALYRKIHGLLKPGGFFVNIDVVLATVDALEEWFLSLWREWISEKKQSLGMTGDEFNDITRKYKDLKENKPDTLDEQLKALRVVGFRDVDCYYKYGIFTIFGGKKEGTV